MNLELNYKLVDQHVGKRLRKIREASGISQKQLGDSLNISFQQIQKYEKGTNRVSASKLFVCAKLLNVSVEYFFEEILEDGTCINKNTSSVKRGDVEMVGLFSEIEDIKVKAEVKRLIKEIVINQSK